MFETGKHNMLLCCSHSFCKLGSPAAGAPEPDPAVAPAMQASAIGRVDGGCTAFDRHASSKQAIELELLKHHSFLRVSSDSDDGRHAWQVACVSERVSAAIPKT